MRTTFTFTAEAREELECPGLALESAFVDDGSRETLVMVYRVDPLPRTRTTTLPIVKFSESKLAIPNAEHFQMGTHRYYREYEGAGSDIRDEMEARFREDTTDTLSRGTGLTGHGSSFSAQTTMGVEDRWLFCTSIVPTGVVGSTLGRLGRRFGYQCGTRILDPAAFAQELGVVFAANTSWDDVRLAGHHRTWQQLASAGGIERTVFVYHGPVSYPNDAAKVVRSFPERHQPAMVPFQKRPEYGWQQEYRFTIGFLGEPEAKTLELPISTRLRGLVKVVWEESARGNPRPRGGTAPREEG